MASFDITLGSVYSDTAAVTSCSRQYGYQMMELGYTLLYSAVIYFRLRKLFTTCLLCLDLVHR